MTEAAKYLVPPEGRVGDYVSYIEEELPINDITQVFGLHDNAEITSMIGTTNEMLAVALSLQGAGAGGGAGGESEEQQVTRITNGILD
jgi:dynein heavy chain